MGKKNRQADTAAGEIGIAAGPWREVLLACRKCGKKLDGGGYGAGGTDTLPDALRRVLRDGGAKREVRVLEVGCLGVCPKGAVAVMRGSAPGAMLVVPVGLDPARVLERLRDVDPAPAAPRAA